MMKKIVLLVCMFLMACSGNQQTEISIAGIYSSLHLGEQSGDTSGIEIHVIPNPTGYTLLIQAAEGAPAYPELYPLQVVGNDFQFVIPQGAKCGLVADTYIGTITTDALSFHGTHPGKVLFILPRGDSYWQ